ncbi:MAG: baseplate J/gp47 family protein [Bacteroidota bacterium]
MAFEPKKFNDIFEDMRARNTQLTDFEVGSVSRTLFESFSYEMAVLYEKMNQIYLSAFVDSATGFQLDQVVAILGIKRSLPDFSVGTVVFERDLGNEAIVIPVGTLVATEDSKENPKKVYQTIEQETLGANEATVAVKVQALQAGENQDAAQGTVIVMPRPIPGVKSVNNEEVIRLIGRRRETDEELRERAKNALIASGKANILAIENAVLSLRRILDVKVQERFHRAEGAVTFSRGSSAEKQYIPKGSELSATDLEGKKWFYRLLEDVPFPIGISKSKARIRAVKEGDASELEASATLVIEDSQLASTFGIDQHSPIIRGEYGIIEVFVDALGFDAPYEFGQTQSLREIVEQEIESVRAAGIFVQVKDAKKIEVDAVIQIQVSASLNLSPEERIVFEKEVQNQIEDYFISLKLGETFAFSQMIKSVISIDGIDNLEDFWLQTISPSPNGPFNIEYQFSNNKITAEDNERFSARHICVASEEKPLPIHLEFQATGIDGQLEAFQQLMLTYFEGRSLGEEIPLDDLQTVVSDNLTAVGATLVASSFKARPESWCDRPTLITEGEVDLIKTSFVERPILGDPLFAYENQLQIDGAIRLQFSGALTQAEKQILENKVKAVINNYLDELNAEEDFIFNQVISRIEALSEVRSASANVDDFQAILGTTALSDRLSEESIGVDPFEKIFIRHLLIADGVQAIDVEVTSLVVTLSVDNTTNQATALAELSALLSHAINNYFEAFSAGDDLIYDTFSATLSSAAPDLTYEITGLGLQATSADGREQTANTTDPNDLKVRSLEIAQMRPFDPNDTDVLNITILT